jgi:hypothetical protein
VPFATESPRGRPPTSQKQAFTAESAPSEPETRISIERIRKVMHAFQGEPTGQRLGVPSRKLWTPLLARDGYLVGQSDCAHGALGVPVAAPGCHAAA